MTYSRLATKTKTKTPLNLSADSLFHSLWCCVFLCDSGCDLIYVLSQCVQFNSSPRQLKHICRHHWGGNIIGKKGCQRACRRCQRVARVTPCEMKRFGVCLIRIAKSLGVFNCSAQESDWRGCCRQLMSKVLRFNCLATLAALNLRNKSQINVCTQHHNRLAISLVSLCARVAYSIHFFSFDDCNLGRSAPILHVWLV